MRDTSFPRRVPPFFSSPETTVRGRLLLISYHFPPGQAAGALRWQKLSRYAAERGWGLDVITLDPSALTEPDWERLSDLPSGVRLYGVPHPRLALDRLEHALWRAYSQLRRRRGRAPADGNGARGRDSRGRGEMRWIPREPRDVLRAYYAWLDFGRHARWARNAVHLACRLGMSREHRAIVTCGPPHMAHEAGRRLARATGLPFILDLRDPWSLVQRLPEEAAHRVWLRLAVRYERRATSRAALIVANTEPLRAAMQAAYPQVAHRVITVMNGTDDEPAPPATHGRRFLIAYAGTIYLDRDPRPLFHAAARVIRELRLGPQDFGIEFMGNAERYDGTPVSALARDAGLDGYFRIHSPRARQESLRFLAGAAMLVILPQDSDLAIPAKLFETMLFDAWLLALAERGSATELLLRGSRAYVVAPRDLEGLTWVLRNRTLDYRCGVRPVRLATNGRFSRRAQADVLFDAVEEIVRSCAVS